MKQKIKHYPDGKCLRCSTFITDPYRRRLTMCDECADKTSKYENDKYHYRTAHRLCVTCGDRLKENDGIRCAECAKYHRERQNYYNLVKREGFEIGENHQNNIV